MTITARFRLVYALLFGGIGIFYAYIALYLKEVGLTGTQIGIVLAVIPLAGVVTQPLWGLLGDVFQIRRVLLAGACFALALAAYLFGLHDGFAWLLGCTIALAVLRSPAGPLCDALALEYLEGQGRRHAFGALRMWGSLGFAVASLAVGALVIGSATRLIVYLYAASVVLMGLVCLTLPDAHTHQPAALRDAPALLRRHPALLKLLLGSLLLGMTLGIVNSYQIIYLADINAPGWVSGLTFAFGGLAEVVFMSLGAAIIRRWGLRAVLIGGIALLPPRWLLYMVIAEPLWVVPTQILHAIGMLSLLIAAVLLVDQQLGGSWRATGQTLYSAALHGVGSTLGLLVAGVIYENIGMAAVWLACAIIGTIGVAVMVWATHAPLATRAETRGV